MAMQSMMLLEELKYLKIDNDYSFTTRIGKYWGWDANAWVVLNNLFIAEVGVVSA